MQKRAAKKNVTEISISREISFLIASKKQFLTFKLKNLTLKSEKRSVHAVQAC